VSLCVASTKENTLEEEGFPAASQEGLVVVCGFFERLVRVTECEVTRLLASVLTDGS
jgi:hypothetical protein